MALNSDQIVTEILEYIAKDSGQYYNDYYVGIAKNPEERLFIQHSVSKEKDYWIYREALNTDEARKTEMNLLAKGMEGGTGGGDEETKFVYCYRIAAGTKE